MNIVTLNEKKALVKTASLGMFKLAKAMGEAYCNLKDYLEKNNIEFNQIPFTSYAVDDWEKTVNLKGFKMLINIFTKKWDIEMGYEVVGDVKEKDDMDVIALPAAEYIETMHIGPYQNVGETYKKIYEYAQKEGYTLGNKSYEYYLNDPREVTKDKLETRVLVPIN